MSEDHNLSEKENSSEENLNPEEKVVQESSDSSETVSIDAVDVESGETETVDVLNDENEEELEQELDEVADAFGDDDDEEDELGDEIKEGEEVKQDSDVFGGEDDEKELAEAESLTVTTEETTAAVAAEPKVKKPVEDEKKWYSLRVISGKERKIKERIELEITRNNWADFVTQILVPSEKVYKIRNGKKVILERNILPGYILVEADPNRFSGEMVQAIVNVPNVIHFLGKNNPIPMQASEANRMLGKVDESQSLGEAMIEPFITGETVKIIDGPFNEFVGDIQEVNEEKKKLKVIVKIFGRGTEVELNFMQVEKQQ